AIARFFMKLCTPQGLKEFAMFFWHQKIFTIVLLAAIGGYFVGASNNWWHTPPPVDPAKPGIEWASFRGGPGRPGAVLGDPEPTTGDAMWAAKPTVPGRVKAVECTTFWASPAVVGNRIYIASCEKGPLMDRGAIFSLDADSGNVDWTWSPKDYRGTFSSPSVAYKRGPKGEINYNEGYLVCGEGTHFTNDARIVCLNLKGELLWQYRTKNHVESSPCIADGRVYIGAGDDGYWCFDLEPKAWEDEGAKRPKPVWHVGGGGNQPSNKYKDCETSPTVVDGVFYAGLGVGGQAMVALKADTGEELWRVEAPCPVFTSPSLGYRLVAGPDKKLVKERLLFLGMGNANFIQSAGEVLAAEKKKLMDKGAGQDEINAFAKQFRMNGEVWCVNVSKIKPGEAVQPEWKLPVKETVLGVAFVGPDEASTEPAEGRLYFGSWDGVLHYVTSDGKEQASFASGSSILTTPAVGKDYVYFSTRAGMLTCVDGYGLKKIWQVPLGEMVMSSPVMARGHVYIGTSGDGLRCIGQVKALPPVWTSGATGGLADRTPLPTNVTFRSRYPSKADPTFRVTAPLMPLGKGVFAPITRTVTTQGERQVRHELVKLRHGELGKKNTDPAEWRTTFDQPITVAPASPGDDVYLVAGGATASSQPDRGTLHALDTNGKKLWQLDLLPGGTGQFFIDGSNLLVWSGPDTLACVNREKGKQLWAAKVPGGHSVAAPSASAGLVLAATAGNLSVVDAGTGAVLWTLPIAPVDSPLRLGPTTLLVATTKGIDQRSIIDGSVQWHTPVGRVTQPLVLDAEKLVAVTDDGKLHVLSLADGLPWRLKDGTMVTAEKVKTPTVRRVAPTSQVDTAITPILLGEKIIFGSPAEPGKPEADLMLISLPDKYQADAAVAATQPEAAAPVAPTTEMEKVTPTRWCEAAFMGAITQPLIVVEGQAYTATKDLGLVYLKK
ncbi:MAG: PQQ-binding-like beta-propeller repeat protein, partial [Phycisphaerae bacterium]|nr:PQQ-binding-like beta-propeller repeat protein [Phycisphaerae bacterium]